MSAQFNDTINYKGLVQLYEQELGMTAGTISGSVIRLKKFAADVNLTLDRFFEIALPASGTWQLDDSNQTDYPIIKTNLVAGQRDYTILTDQDGNLVLDIYKAMILPSATATEYIELTRKIDQQSELSGIDMESAQTGVPIGYDKTANGIFLDPKPSYNATNGLKLFVNREASYFAYNDTTKKPGVPGLFHAYFFKRPAQQYAARNSLAIAGGRLRNGAFTGLLMEVNDMETDIKKYFGGRARDEKPRMTPRITPFI